MYEVSIFNNNIETVIQSLSTDQEAPHIDKLPLKEGLSMVDSLSFVLYANNPGYNSLFELTTKVKVTDTRDNTTRFTGRVLDVNEHMDSNGLFYKEVLCESALSYLNDTKQRANAFATTDATIFLMQILAIHNSKVDASKQIQVGNVDIVGSVAYSCNFKSTLAELIAVKDKMGGEIRVREVNDILYLDWLQSFSINTVEITLGENMKDMIKGKDVTSLGTRIIPLGANNLTIASVNGGKDYIEDIAASSTYGVIEKTVEYKDIIDATELYNTCMADLSNYTQPLFLLESNALDLSFLTGNKPEQFMLGINIHLNNPVMGVDSIYKAVQIELDLLQAYDPKLTIANFPLKLSSTINDLRASSMQNNGVYNNVQVGDAFGIRAVRSDGKVVTTLNATEGISIENENQKVLYVDVNGNIIANSGTYNDITANNVTAVNGTYTNIKAVNMVANEMKTSATLDYIKLHALWMDFFSNGSLEMQMGILDFFGAGIPAIYAAHGLALGSAGSITLEGSTVNLKGNVQVNGAALTSGLQMQGNYLFLTNGCYLECLAGRLILHANSTNYVSIGAGLMQVTENGVSRPI